MISSLLIALLATTGVNNQQVAMNTATTPAATTDVDASAKPSATKPKKEKRYCVDQTYTGTRMPRRSCNTRDGWLATGWDPLEAK